LLLLSVQKPRQFDINLKRALFNDLYYPYLDSPTPIQIFFGGASAGKSAFIVGQRTVYDLLKGRRNYLIVRNVARTSRTSTFNQVKQTINTWNVNSLFKINESEMSITCINGYQILIAGLDDVQKLKSVLPQKGVLTDIIIEEATETNQDDIRQLRIRLRGRSEKPKRLTLLFNPILQSHWIFQEHFKGRFQEGDKIYHDDNILIVHCTHEDNRFLEQADHDALINQKNQYHYDVYTLGKWGVLGGVIFTNWRVEDLSEMIPTFDNIKNGLDFGFSNHPTAYNRIHYDKKRKKIYIFEEMHEYAYTNLMIAEWLAPVVGKEFVICDSAEPKSIRELCDYKINAIGAKKGKDSVHHGIQFMQQHEIIIDRCCQETINEFQQYQWKKLKTGESTNVPVDANNHHIDGIRYALEDEMTQLTATPRIAVIGANSNTRKMGAAPPADLKLGETSIPIYEGDTIVGYDILRPGGGRGRGRIGISKNLINGGISGNLKERA
jgi:phage terminase large subunit